jgi:thioredoxin 1
MITIKRFTSTWCQPCRQLAPVFEQLKTEYNNVGFETIDIDLNKSLTQQYSVTSIPTVIVEKEGQIIRRFVGIQPKSSYVNAIKSLI